MVVDSHTSAELTLGHRRGTGPLVRVWLQRHAQSFFAALGHLSRSLGSTVLTVLVISIALALPTGLYVLLHNAEQVTSQWEGGAELSVFLAPATDLQVAGKLALEMMDWSEVESTHLISPAEALAEFEAKAGISGVSVLLEGDNPLPPVISVRMASGLASEQVADLAKRINQWQEVDVVELDRAWLKRLQAIIDLVERAVWILAALLSVGVVLIVGNTIRAGIDMRREEIEISLLFGATHAFIRRPFLYGGLAMGFGGAILAWVIVITGLLLLAGPVQQLSELYASTYSLDMLSLSEGLLVIVMGAGLGGGGALVAVGRHLRTIKPE